VNTLAGDNGAGAFIHDHRLAVVGLDGQALHLGHELDDAGGIGWRSGHRHRRRAFGARHRRAGSGEAPVDGFSDARRSGEIGVMQL
jgi:hypothetical protein